MQFYKTFFTVFICGFLASQLNASSTPGAGLGEQCNLLLRDCAPNLICVPYEGDTLGIYGHCLTKRPYTN
uniref:Uncharacterized protein n=1 Tax=Ditylenchus dipsaci TaxID=166011 RepID=A0A915CMK1_9BILA